MRLEIIIHRMEDGRIYIEYCWHWWERYHREYFEDAVEAAKFLEKLMLKTKWR